MKFNQIADGQQFEYQGAVYTKNGPLMAVDEQGKSKLLPRSAAVRPVSARPPEPSPDVSRSITAGQIIQSFEIFYEQCLNSIDTFTAGLDVQSTSDLKQSLEAARQTFLKSL